METFENIMRSIFFAALWGCIGMFLANEPSQFFSVLFTIWIGFTIMMWIAVLYLGFCYLKDRFHAMG